MTVILISFPHSPYNLPSVGASNTVQSNAICSLVVHVVKLNMNKVSKLRVFFVTQKKVYKWQLGCTEAYCRIYFVCRFLMTCIYEYIFGLLITIVMDRTTQGLPLLSIACPASIKGMILDKHNNAVIMMVVPFPQ